MLKKVLKRYLKQFEKETLSTKSDFGRKYGWWVMIEGECVASLEYRLWDSNLQFWHIYEIIPMSQTFNIFSLNPADWANSSTIIQSRYATSFTQKGVIASFRKNNCIAIRDLRVPDTILKATEGEYINLTSLN